MSEKTELHDLFIRYLKKEKLKFTRKNWNNHKRQVDDGFPDFAVFIDMGETIFIEFKIKEKYFFSENHGLTSKQVEWKNYLEKNNHKYMVTWNIHDAIGYVDICLMHRAG
jgi:hypothetical protein